MSGVAPPGAAHTADPVWPPTGESGLLFLLAAATPQEREALERWLTRAMPSGVNGEVEVVSLADTRLDERLNGGDDPQIAPLRVAWLPPERNGNRAARISDALTGRNPRRPGAPAQARILREEPDRCRVVLGEPAHVSDLRRRWRDAGGSDDLPAFVRRQATLALERAERAVIGTQYKVPRLVYDEIVASARFRTGAERLAERLDRKPVDVIAEAAGCLDEMVASQSRVAIDMFSQFGRWMSRAYTVEVDDRRVEELRELASHQTLVFLPGHKSYLDPLVLRPVLLEQGFGPNHVLGGINVAFWPMGAWARRTGMVFIRRSFKDNPVYKFVLQEYMAYLVRKRFNLEWYLEGGRTRTGKLRPPRYGLLAYLVRVLREGAADDVTLVPVSIVYDQLQEVGAMAHEAGGGTKRKESLGWMLGYARAQGAGFGKVRVAFGEPLSLRDSLAAADADPADANGAGREGAEHLAVAKTAFEVCHRINQVTSINATSLVTLALLGVEDRALTLSEITSILDPLLEYAERRALPGTGELLVGQQKRTRRTLEALAGSGVVRCFDEGTEPVYCIGSDQHLVAAFYRNSAIHFFVTRAIIELVLVRAIDEGFEDPLADAVAEAMRLRDLLKFEFFFPGREEFIAEMRAELELIDPEWEASASTPEALLGPLTESHLYLAHRVLRSFLEAYRVVADRLAARDPAQPVERKAFLAECRGVGRQYRLQQRIWSTESISEELFDTALRLAANRNLVEPGPPDLAERRRAFAAEVNDVARRIGRVRDLAIADLPGGAG